MNFYKSQTGSRPPICTTLWYHTQNTKATILPIIIIVIVIKTFCILLCVKKKLEKRTPRTHWDLLFEIEEDIVSKYLYHHLKLYIPIRKHHKPITKTRRSPARVKNNNATVRKLIHNGRKRHRNYIERKRGDRLRIFLHRHQFNSLSTRWGSTTCRNNPFGVLSQFTQRAFSSWPLKSYNNQCRF